VITRDLLRELGDWRAEKEGRALAANGSVLDWQYDPPVLHGTVRTSGGLTIKARIKLGQRAVEVENLCSCRQAREEGTICAHVMALVFATMETPAAKPKPAAPPPAPVQPAIPHFKRVPMDEAADTSARLELMVLLPLDLPKAWKSGSLRIILEGSLNGEPFRPFDTIPPQPASPYAVSDADARLLDVVERLNEGRAPGIWILPRAAADTFFSTLIGHPRIWLGKKTLIEVHRADERPQLALHLEPTGELRLRLEAGAAPELDQWTFDGKRLTRCAALPPGYPTGEHRLSREEFVRFYQRELPALQAQATTELSPTFDQLEFVENPAPVRIVLDGGLAGLNLELRLAAKTDWQPDPSHPFRYWRHTPFDASAITAVGFEPRGSQPHQYRMTSETRVGHFLANVLPRWEHDPQWTIEYGPQFAQFLRKCDRITPAVEIANAGNNWLAVDVRYQDDAGATALTGADVQRMLQKGASHHRQVNGRIALVPTDAVQQFQGVIYDCDASQSQDTLRIERTFAPYLAEALRESPIRAQWQVPTELRPIREIHLTDDLAQLLRPYQREGVQWLQFLADNHMAGILADEMGLGKTLQALAWLSSQPVGQAASLPPLEEQNGSRKLAACATNTKKPSLVICPTSLLANWEAEAQRFTPGLKTLVLHGTDRHESFDSIADHNLVITSYALLRRDAARHQGIEWHAVILDEAQHIKNRFSQNAQTVKSLRAAHRLVLTGTPMENSLEDLWSIYDFLMPGYLGPAKEFRDRYELPIAKQQDTAALQRLRQRLRPFLLRRTKQEVAKELPAKIDQVTWCEMSDEQQSVYQQILAAGRREVFDHAGKGGESKQRMAVLSALLRLRQASCHLGLLPSDQQWTAPSAKLATCLELIDEAVSGGHRVLVFSQFVKFLRLAEAALQEQATPYCYLDGSTVDRAGEIRRFQESDIPVFLISLKAGGTGLNLTGADTVIHLDPWWNPAVEDQATARAHRIGQRNVVTSYKLIAKGSVEEKIVKLQEKKRELISQTVTTDEAFVQRLSMEELTDLLR
jgi:superfamily II DNA or RNA helicase